LLISLLCVVLIFTVEATKNNFDSFENDWLEKSEMSNELDEMDMTQEYDELDELDMSQDYDKLAVFNVSARSLNVADGSFWSEQCYPAFDEHMVDQLKETIQGCSSYQRDTRLKGSEIITLKEWWLSSAELCHIQCFTFPECVGFASNPGSRTCYLIKNGNNDNLFVPTRYFTSGLRSSCTESLDNDVDEYFSNPLQRQIAAKTEYLLARENYDRELASRRVYSKIVTQSQCLHFLINFGAITEDELETPTTFDTEEVPFLPLDNANPSSKSVSIIANSGELTIPNAGDVLYKNWVMTGLYAPPGKIISVVTPERAVGNIILQIGANTDDTFRYDDKTKRDPIVTMDFAITSGTQDIGSPYGGLIVVKFVGSVDLSGEIIEITFDSVLDAPHFVLGIHSNEDWNNNMKHLAAPWTVFEIPNHITFIVPTRERYSRVENKLIEGAYQQTDVTTRLEEWKNFIERADQAAGITDRPVAEVMVLDIELACPCWMHAGYPMGGFISAIGSIFPSNSLDSVSTNTALGHEIGHNLSPKCSELSHESVELFTFFALPATRVHGIWGRESRLFGYIKTLEQNQQINAAFKGMQNMMPDLQKIPFDGLDGTGWGDEGSWNDYPSIINLYKNFPRVMNTESYEYRNWWVERVCQGKQMNMVEYFKFWEFDLKESTIEACNQYASKPTEMMAWINHIEHLANDENNCPQGWFGHSQKCFKLNSGKYTYSGAKEYCQGLGAAISLASIADRDDEMLVDWTFIQSEKKPFWVEDVPNHAEIYPQTRNYEVQSGSNTILWISSKNMKCHYKNTKKAMHGTTDYCLAPLNKPPKKKYGALCEMAM